MVICHISRDLINQYGKAEEEAAPGSMLRLSVCVEYIEREREKSNALSSV